MLEWLHEKRQTGAAIRRFWSPVLVSAINEDLDRMAAIHGFHVVWDGFLARPNAYEMGVPNVPLGDLYAAGAWAETGNIRLHPRASVERVIVEGQCARAVLAAGEQLTADYYISALPFDRLPAILPELDLNLEGFEHSPITGVHLWFDRSVTDLPHATLLDRTIQWMFNKSGGRYLQLVISASRSLVETQSGRRDRHGHARARRIFTARERREAREGACCEGSSRDLFGQARYGETAARQRHQISEFLPGGRLDPVGLAGHHGRRGSQRVSCG